MDYIKLALHLVLAPIFGILLITLAIFTGLIALPFEIFFGEKNNA